MPSKLKASDFNSTVAFRCLVAIVALLNLTAYLLGFWWLTESRKEYEQRAKIDSQNISHALAQGIAHAFDKVELVMLEAREEMTRRAKDGALDNKTMAPYLTVLQMRVPELTNLRATDADGVLVYGYGAPTSPPANLADDSNFAHLRDHPHAGTSIAKPASDMIDHAWLIKLARRYDKADGSFGGIIIGTIAFEQLIALVPELDIGPNGFISLRDGDLGLIFRIPKPGIGKNIGQRNVPAEYGERVQALKESGNFLAISPNDQVERMVAFHKIGKWDMYLSVGLAVQDYLGKWRQEVWLTILAETVLTILSVLLVALLYRYARDRNMYVAKLQEQQAVFRTLAEISSDWFWEQDSEYRFTHMTRDLSYRLSSGHADFVGKTRWDVAVEPDETQWEKHKALLDARQSFQDFEYSFIDENGQKRTVSTSGSPVFDKDGNFVGYRGTTKDITERREYELRIQNMAQYDSLTGLPNRALFYDRITQAISLARRNQRRFALLYLDLDKFKPVNDTYGHDTGDKLLKMVVRRLESVLRQSDTLARLGGDEFALIMPNIDSMNDPVTVAEKVIGVIAEPFQLEKVDADLVIGISIGIALFPDDAGGSPDDLVRAADQAMYCAKKYGNAYRFHVDGTAIHIASESRVGKAASESALQVRGPASSA